MSSDIIVESLELVAARAGDPAPLVYERLFAKHPAMKVLFVMDRDDAVKGNMLAEFIEGLLDLAGERSYATGLIPTEMINHEGMGVPRDVFPTFFGVVRDTFQNILGDEWTPVMDSAWNALGAELDEMLDANAMA